MKMNEIEMIRVNREMYNEIAKAAGNRDIFNLIVDDAIPYGKGKIITEKMIDMNTILSNKTNPLP